jgi:hypothetical protein
MVIYEKKQISQFMCTYFEDVEGELFDESEFIIRSDLSVDILYYASMRRRPPSGVNPFKINLCDGPRCG